MVRLGRARSDKRVRTLFQGLTDEKFQFAGLVAAERKTGLIITFDEQSRPTKRGRQ